tara:strand:+ start:2165 stop:2755 length:591 start_codon:yes stop_codon:yes gene_type:complete
MFNGIIFNSGKVVNINKGRKGINLFIKSNIKLTKKNLGISVACDGVCLTLISANKNIFEFYLSKETIIRSNFKRIKIGNILNIELPLKYGQSISGHICQGHVDTTAKVNKIVKYGKSVVYDFSIKKNLIKSLIDKASILVNGVSLTISKVTKSGFQVWTIPHTLKLTNLSKLKKNDVVNVEIDILSKYTNKFLNEK